MKPWPRQPFVGLGIATVAGILIADRSPHNSLGLWLFLAFAIFAWVRRSSLIVYLAAALAFFYLHSARQIDSPGHRLAREWGEQRRAMSVEGSVITEPTVSARGTSSFHLRLNWYEHDRERTVSRATILARWKGEVHFGDELQSFGVAQPIDGPRNPGEFDMREYLARRDVHHVLISRYAENGKVSSRGGGNPLLRAAQRSRQWMRENLARGLEDSPDLTGLISAMVLGARDQTADEIEEQFQQTGTIHLFAVSGLHVGIVGYLLWTIARTLRLPRKWAVALIIPALFFYAAITGLNTSSVRAALMAAFLLGGLSFERRVFPANSVAAAGVFILAQNSNQLFATGFQLSFAVVISIILCAQPLYRWLIRRFAFDPFLPQSLLNPLQRLWQNSWRTVSRGASVSLAAWFGSMVFILPYFYLVTPVSLFANLIVIPIAFFILTVGLLSLLSASIAPGLAIIFNNANWSLSAAILATAGFFTRAPAGHFYVELPNRTNGAPVEITALDLGAGAAVHIRTPESDCLIDCGALRDFRRVVRGYLRSRGINRLDGILLTHGDAGHLGGGASIERSFHPRAWIDNAAPDRSGAHKTLISYLAEQQIERQLRSAPDELRLGKSVTARLLFPPPGFNAPNANDQATVVQLEVAHRWRVLLTSDAGLSTERWLLRQYSADLASDILIKGQHQSGVSGSDEFLACVQPRLIVATSPEFPENERVKDDWAQAVADRGIKLFRQDQTGAVSIRFYRQRWEAVPYLPHEIVRSLSPTPF
ncbi:MAG: ComEC/Rec2 family competence protein [Chthoniobacterales bacterium]